MSKLVNLQEWKISKAKRDLFFFLKHFLQNKTIKIPRHQEKFLRHIENAKQGNSLEEEKWTEE